MASLQADFEKLVKRCQDLAPLGWRVETTTDGWRILAPNGATAMIHKTYSDRRAWTHHMVEFNNRLGFKAAEAEMKARRLKERRNRLAAERLAADKRATAISERNQGAVTKAAGPYLTVVEECDPGWLVSPHPAPWMRWMYITPKVAEQLLEEHNDDNRPLSEAAAERYAAMILSDQWYLTHQGLAIDDRAKVQDAQHRLRAVVLAGMVNPDIKVPFAVFVGMPPKNFVAIDEGRLRTAAQMLSKSGVPGGTNMVTLMRAVAAFDAPDPRKYNRGVRFTQVEAHELWNSDPDGWRDAYSLAHRGHRKSGKVIPLGCLGAAYYLIRKANGLDNVYVKGFFEGLIANRKWNTHLVLPDDDPRATVLSRFRTGKPTAPVEGVFWIIAAWNNFVRGHHPMILRFNPNTPVPKILLCKPGEGQAPKAMRGELDALRDELEDAA